MKLLRLAVSTSVACALVLAAGATALATPAAPSTHHRDAAVKHDLRSLAVDEETFLTDKAHYGSFKALHRNGQKPVLSKHVRLTIRHYLGTTGYCLVGTSLVTHDHFVYDSQAGGLTSGNRCPTTRHGKFGGTRVRR